MLSRPSGLFAGEVRVATTPPRFPRQNRPDWPKELSRETLIALGLGEYCWTARLHDCRACGALFIAHYTAHLCSGCLTTERAKRTAAERAWREAYRAARPTPKAALRRAALARAVCEVCNVPLHAQRLTARFCSNRCRQQHHRTARKLSVFHHAR